MKKAGFVISHFAALVATTAVQAQSVEVSILETMNPNAMAQTILDVAAGNSGQTSKSYLRADDISLLCLGKIGLNQVEIKTAAGNNVLAEPVIPEIARFAYDPKAKNKDAQDKIRGLLENRSDLAYLEFVTRLAPDAKQVSAYFEKTYAAKPLDAYTAGTGFNDGSVRTTLLLDQALLEKFAADHANDIAAVSARFQKNPQYEPVVYSHCGPRFTP